MPARVDTKEVEVFDEEGNGYGKFTVKPQDTNQPMWLKRLMDAKKVLSPHDRNRVEKPKTEADIQFGRNISIKLFVDHYVADSVINDADGKPLEHSKEMVLAYLSDPERFWIFRQVDDFAADLANFRKEAVKASKNG